MTHVDIPGSRTFRPPVRVRVRGVLYAVFCMAFGLAMVPGALALDPADDTGTPMMIAMVLIAVCGGPWYLHHGFKSATLSEAGIRSHGPLGSRSMDWADVEYIEASFTTPGDRKRERVRMLGTVGRVAAAASNLGSGSGYDPFRCPGTDRTPYTGKAKVIGRDRRWGPSFTERLGWDFFDVLVDEADARGIDARPAERGERLDSGTPVGFGDTRN